MRLAAYRGNSVHAPENTRAALISGYTAGADALQVQLQLTADGHVVLSQDPTTKRLTGQDMTILDTKLGDLRALDVSKTFVPRGSPGFSYRPPHRKQLEIETLPELLDLLPEDVDLVVELTPQGDRTDDYVAKAVGALDVRGRLPRTVFSGDADLVAAVRAHSADVRVVLGGADVDAVAAAKADGLVVATSDLLDGAQKETPLARAIADAKLRVGAVVVGDGDPAAATKAQYETLATLPYVHSLAVASVLDAAPLAYRQWRWIDEPFGGQSVDTHRFHLGYAKANKYARVFQDDGVHVKIDPYDGPVEVVTSTDPAERRLEVLEENMMYALTNWPFYSGGGVGLVLPIEGSFAAEVDFEADVAQQSTMCELAVTNVDPAAHQPDAPGTARQKAAFFNPHGAPPFVGAEHDEDDGYRINWNLGSEYDDNQYGRPVGDGTVLAGRFRLERRGHFFSAYYRNAADATDWVCVGAVCNDSLNARVYLRAAGKRWRQETPEDPTKFFPVPANHFVFANLTVDRFPF
jgi:glycerophosphoryl diester phosphodiesterase